jgi:hypothetical protein
MNRILGAVLFVILLGSSTLRAEELPTFHPRSTTRDATHIVVVKTEGEGKFQVLESWKGDLKKGTVLQLPALAKDGKGEMVLFMKGGPERWQAGSVFGWQTSVAWFDGEKVLAVTQPEHSLNPTEVKPLGMVRLKLRELIEYGVRTDRALADAREQRDVERRVAALVEIVNGDSDRKEEAFADLGKCGAPALPALRTFLKQPPNFAQMYAISALAEAGGKEIVPEVCTMLKAELGYWKVTAPKLQKGWWLQNHTDTEEWKRYGILQALIAVYKQHPTPELRFHIVTVRDTLRAFPTLDKEQGISSISAYCDYYLKGDR